MTYYTDAQRAVQTDQNSTVLAEALEGQIIVSELDDMHQGFIGSRDFFFLSTVTGAGEPTVSYKGGGVGIVKVVDPTTLLFPSYDGNGMFLSMGNIADTGKIGMLFIDFETPNRVRVQATASLSQDAADLAHFPGADMVVRATVDTAFVNCGRYIHKHERVATSRYVPDAEGYAPVPAWKRIDALQPVFDDATRAGVEAEGGTIEAEDYAARVADGNP